MHGHVDPWLLADPEATLGDPADALVSGDHYVFRMLHSRGTPLEELGVRPNTKGAKAADPRAVWQRFAEGFSLFAGTPTGLWLALELSDVFGIETPLNGSTAQQVYDELAEKLSLPEYSPRALFDRFRIEVLCTTDSILDELAAHEALHADGMGQGRVRPTLRADPVMRADDGDWAANVERLAALSDSDVGDYASLVDALSARLVEFKRLGATGIDISVTIPRAEFLPVAEADSIVRRGLRGLASADDGARLAARLVLQFAELSRDEGLVMQLHAGSSRNHHVAGYGRFGADIGADIPIRTEWTRNLGELLNAYGHDPGFTLVAYTLDESTLTRELAPLAGYYPALVLGAPWWFLDSPVGIRRFLDAAASICGLANTAGFVDDTRAVPSIPARHEVWRARVLRLAGGAPDERPARRGECASARSCARRGLQPRHLSPRMSPRPELEAMFGLADRVAVVTGASGALGSAIARALGLAGAKVALLARQAEGLRRVHDALGAEGIDAFPVPADVLSSAELNAARDMVLEHWGHVDALVCAAGGQVPAAVVAIDGAFTDIPEEAFRAALDLNLLGAWLPCQTFADELAAGGGEGAIVTISSIAGRRALTRVPAYAAAKGAIESLTRSLAIELAQRYGDRLRVNAIAPGFFLGAQNRALLLDDDEQPTARGEAILAHTPAGRFGEPGDIGGAAVWLCSPASRFVTGTVIAVDGGFGAFSGV